MKPWQEQAAALRPGQRMRVLCECAPHRSESLMIEHREDGSLRGWCFRCKDPDMYVPPPHMSLAEKLARAKALRERDKEFRDTVILPAPQVWEPEAWPLQARVWLYKAGLSDTDILNHGIYWHEPTQRVVLPVLDERQEQVVYWQARGFEEHAPKYINPRVDRAHIVYRSGDVRSAEFVVLTEDILSAIKVGKVTPAWSLLGTDLKDNVLAQILARNLGVVVWMDNDQGGSVNPGQDAAAAICHRLRVFGVPHANVVSRADPKLLSLGEIEQHIREIELCE